jgi:hypothetical protein
LLNMQVGPTIRNTNIWNKSFIDITLQDTSSMTLITYLTSFPSLKIHSHTMMCEIAMKVLIVFSSDLMLVCDVTSYDFCIIFTAETVALRIFYYMFSVDFTENLVGAQTICSLNDGIDDYNVLSIFKSLKTVLLFKSLFHLLHDVFFFKHKMCFLFFCSTGYWTHSLELMTSNMLVKHSTTEINPQSQR